MVAPRAASLPPFRARAKALKMLLLEPGKHSGEMATGGLSGTDFGKKEGDLVPGVAFEFYWRAGLKYDIRPLR